MTAIVVILSTVALSSCQRVNDDRVADAVQTLQREITVANDRLDALDSTIQALMTAERERNKNAVLDPSDPSFQRLDSNISSFAVSVDNVTPRADGVAVRLMMGVLSSATINGATLTAEYGPRYPEIGSNANNWAEDVKKWEGAVQKREVKISDSMAPGRWNPVILTLPNIKPDEFGYLSIRIQTPTIALMK